MKIKTKLFWIYAFIAIIGFSALGCGFLLDNNDARGTNGNSSTQSNSSISIKNWDSPIFTWASLAGGKSRTVTLPQSITGNSSYDVKLAMISETSKFIRYGVSISNGTILTFSDNDLQ